MANFVYVLVKGMDKTPGGADESLVPADQRLGQPVELDQRVQLLVRLRTVHACWGAEGLMALCAWC